jgi:hypothetical protein
MYTIPSCADDGLQLPAGTSSASGLGYTRVVAKKKPKQRPSGKRNTSPQKRWQRGSKYSPAELFMAGCGALILIMFIGIIITAVLGG